MKQLTIREQLSRLKSWVEDGEPFFHTRFNDGEVNGMLKLVPETATTSGEHHHFRDLGEKLLSTFEEVCREAAKNPRVLLGSWWQSFMHEDLARVMFQHLSLSDLPTNFDWGQGDLFYSTKGEEVGDVAGPELLALIESMRRYRQVELIGNVAIRDAKYCFEGGHVHIPAVDAWLVRDRITKVLDEVASQGEILFVWCAGLPGKVWMRDLWRRFPQTSHLDAGHLFDGVFNVRNRAWLTRSNGAHCKWVNETLTPYVKGFVP